MDERMDVAVIGGGVVGLCAAFYLARDGRRVTVFDAGHEGAASDGNAGMIVPSHIVPLAAPGAVSKGLRWLLDPESPFLVKLRPDPDLLRWLWRFRSCCTAIHVERSIPILRDLSLASVALLEEIASIAGGETGYANTGLLMLYHTEKGRKDNLEMADRAEAAGLDVARLDRQAVGELDAEIRAPFDGAVYYRQDGRVDPGGLLSALGHHLRQIGGTIRRGVNVQRFERQGRRIVGMRTSAGVVKADEVVLAAGAWSAALTRTLGVRLPLQPAKGYSITRPAAPSSPRIPHILTEEKLTVTPMPGRLRFSGTLAFSGFDGSVDLRRTAPLVRLVRTYGLEATDASRPAPNIWYGYRPCSPDGLPLIGRVGAFENVTVATGHGMMGVTLAPITGKLVAEIVRGAPPSLDAAPFRPDRW